jgi:hypothetical protein
MFIAACGGDDDASLASGDERGEPADDASEGRGDGSSGTTEPSPEDAAVQVYLDGNDAMEQALASFPVNPVDPVLDQYFSGPALSENRSLLAQLRQAGEYYETTFEAQPDVASASPEEVLLTDCVSESTTSFDGASGAPKESGEHVYNWHIRVVNTDAGWRVNEITPQEGSCTP